MKEFIRDLATEFGPLQQSVTKGWPSLLYICQQYWEHFYRIRVFEGIAASTNEYIYYIDLEKSG